MPNTTEIKDLEKEFDPKKLLIQTGITLGLTTILLLILMVVFKEPVFQFGRWFFESFGLAGVGVFSYITDTLILPSSLDLAFPLAIQQKWEPVSLLTVMCIASILGGCSGWFIGRFFQNLDVVRKSVEFYHQKGEILLKRFGFWAVVIAAVTPVPYSAVSWISGMMKLPFHTYFLASLFRIPRVIIMYLLLAGILQFLV